MKNNYPTMTLALAYACGQDAANRQMRKAGRRAWNRADYNLAIRTTGKLMRQLTP